jgi:hypothetical protein
MTRPAEAIAAAQAVIADRYATAAAAAAREATRAARMAVQPSRVQNVTTEFIGRAEKAEQTGEEYEPTLTASSAYGQMAGIASTAKFTAAAANATRYAAAAALNAGAPGAARRAERAAEAATWWAEMAQSRAANSHYAPYTATKTARSARRAAAAARYAARASGPLGRFATGAVGLAVGPMTSDVLRAQRRALELAQDGTTTRVLALERYADQIIGADDAERDWQQARRLSEHNDKYLDLVARTAADDYATAEMAGLTEQLTLAARTRRDRLHEADLAARALVLP